MGPALIAFAAMLVLVFLRVPIAFAMGLVGFVGFGLATNWNASLAMIATVTTGKRLVGTLSLIGSTLYLITSASKAFCACSRFSAWSQIAERGP